VNRRRSAREDRPRAALADSEFRLLPRLGLGYLGPAYDVYHLGVAGRGDLLGRCLFRWRRSAASCVSAVAALHDYHEHRRTRDHCHDHRRFESGEDGADGHEREKGRFDRQANGRTGQAAHRLASLCFPA
jgi:hypothetical protein